MITAHDIITGAAKLIGVVFKSESLTSDEANDGLTSLNDMIASWGNNSLLITARTWETFSVSAATSYTIGTGQTLNTTRPTAIIAAYTRNGGIDYPMEMITDEEYAAVSLKSTSTPFPSFLSYDNGYAVGIIRLYPLLGSSSSLFLLTEKPITEFAELTTTVNLAAGWNRALRFNLAVEMAAEYGVPVPEQVAKIASTSLASISLAIAKNRPIRPSFPVVRERNIYTGWA